MSKHVSGPGWGQALALSMLIALAGCSGKGAPPPPAPPEVSVIRVQPRAVTLFDEYVAQTESPDTIEIRAQVTGLLERKAFADGARVAKGELLYIIDQRPFESQLLRAQANLTQAQASLVNARDTLTRQRKLLAAHFVSQQAYDDAVAQERVAAAQVEAQKAAVRVAQLDLGYTRISAPREGYVSVSLVKPGALITAQQTLLTTLYSSDPMWVYFAIDESKLLALQEKLRHPSVSAQNAEAPFHIRFVDGSEYRFPGRLDFVDAAVDEKTGTLQARISVPNPDRVLRPGLFVRVTVPAVREANAIVIPQQAVQEQQGLKSVFVVDAASKVQPRQIVAGQRAGQSWIVDSGLRPGEQVVVEGVGKLRPGQQVKAALAEDGAAPTAQDQPTPRSGTPAGIKSGPVAAEFVRR